MQSWLTELGLSFSAADHKPLPDPSNNQGNAADTASLFHAVRYTSHAKNAPTSPIIPV
jgi:hypothetical protein